MKEKEKIAKAVKLFDEIKTMFPDGQVDMTMHDVDMKLLDANKWKMEVDQLTEDSEQYMTAKRIGSDVFDITFFS